MGVHNVEKKDTFQEAIAKPELTVVDFFATWFSDTYTNVKFLKLDVDELSEVAAEWSVSAMPTFLLFKNGEKVGEVVGANARALEAEIKKAIES
ncbi:MAG: Cytoplasmic thioredoxin isoenzyme 2 [Lichina confinis]|nr:MAG: Cytoplasmic thioredoxin isoenzyme 2 [Lichina confinis]